MDKIQSIDFSMYAMIISVMKGYAALLALHHLLGESKEYLIDTNPVSSMYSHMILLMIVVLY